MKRRKGVGVKTLLAVFLVFGIVQAAAVEKKIRWLSYNEGMSLAKAAGKPMMLVFTAEWCSWCRKLEEETFCEGSVVTLSADFVCVRVDVDEESELIRRFGVRGIPVVLFTDEGGNELHRVVGFADEAELLDEMLKALSAVGKTPSVSIQIPETPARRIPAMSLAPLLSIFIAYVLRRGKRK
ncbi:MAG: hypothetical protein DRN91_05975 [Candidatus Alkanophagales archaeon]|nr:MAG: hypothetical protein DRN91_05975 [Candidatus Alkanophagales archaeon]